MCPPDEEAKAIQEVAKTTGKGIDAARDVGRFIARYVSGPLEEGVGIVHDRLKYARWERQVRLMRRADEFLARLGQSGPTKPVPLKLMVPILQGAVLEDNDDLQDRWAALLANAANANCRIDVQRGFLDILGQLSVLEARILDTIYSLPFEQARHVGISTYSLPATARVLSESEPREQEPGPEIALALGNLVRLGCLKAPSTWGGGESFASINPTTLGNAFVQACRQPDA